MPTACTIVIPAFNAAPYLAETLASLTGQSRGDWHAVVVDDGSTDDTRTVALDHAGKQIQVIHQENRGVSAARNRGFDEVKSPFVIFLDADDRLLPHALEALLTPLERDAKLTAAYGEGRLIDEDGAQVGPGKPSLRKRPSGDVLPTILQRNFILTGGLLCARSERVREAGLFREDLRLHEDWEHWCRLAQTGPFHYVGPDAILEYRQSAQSVVASIGTNVDIAMANVEAVFHHPQLSCRFSPGELKQLRRRSEASIYSFMATQQLKRRAFDLAAESLEQSLKRHLLQPRELLLWCCAKAGILPAPIRARLK